MRKTLELRNKAKDELGDKLDIRYFHEVMISAGAIPLPILALQVKRYIQKK